MNDKKYVVFWDDNGNRLYRLHGLPGFTSSIFEAEWFSFNLAASEYFKWRDNNPDVKYGVACFEAKLTEVEIEVTELDDDQSK